MSSAESVIPVRTASAELNSLTDEILIKIFVHLDFKTRCVRRGSDASRCRIPYTGTAGFPSSVCVGRILFGATSCGTTSVWPLMKRALSPEGPYLKSRSFVGAVSHMSVPFCAP